MTRNGVYSNLCKYLNFKLETQPGFITFELILQNYYFKIVYLPYLKYLEYSAVDNIPRLEKIVGRIKYNYPHIHVRVVVANWTVSSGCASEDGILGNEPETKNDTNDTNSGVGTSILATKPNYVQNKGTSTVYQEHV